jgi:molybdate transport system regulatory protein
MLLFENRYLCGYLTIQMKFKKYYTTLVLNKLSKSFYFDALISAPNVIFLIQITFSMTIKDFLKPEKEFRITGIIRIESQDNRFFGPGRLQLLENIIETGSISQAAKKMGMSYKKAWDLVNSMNQHTIKPIVSTQTGGEKGGGTIVTEEGKQLVTAFRKLHEEFQQSFDDKIKEFLNS